MMMITVMKMMMCDYDDEYDEYDDNDDDDF